MPNPFRHLPSVNQLLENPSLKSLVDRVNHQVVVEGVRNFLDDMRRNVANATGEVHIPSPSELAERIASWLERSDRPPLQPVINGTGILLHTGLGRAPLAEAALEEIRQVAGGYASVEVDLATGGRGQRVKAVEKLLCELTGAEAAVVMNNNAAATMLTLSTLASGKEVIVSRGQLVEIGGSYRLPDVMECSGARLREIGTTNKTRPDDYRSAMGEETGALLRVHPSNYEIVGFTESVSIGELVRIANGRVPVIDDIGSGALIDFTEFGLRNEPMARQSIADGADVVLFSGDKLLGGPQCGIVVGKQKYVRAILEHPMMRAMRVGKLTLAALAATLRLYRQPEAARLQIPLLRMLSTSVENLELRANKIAGQVAHLPWVAHCEAIPEHAMLGGGSLPTQQIPSWAVALQSKERSVDQLAAKLRMGFPSVVGRVQQDRLLLDMRTIAPHSDMAVVQRLEALETDASE